jgi:hypothetical protein
MGVKSFKSGVNFIKLSQLFVRIFVFKRKGWWCMRLGLVSKGKLVDVVNTLGGKSIDDWYSIWHKASGYGINYDGQILFVSSLNVIMSEAAVDNKFLLLDLDGARSGSIPRGAANDDDGEVVIGCSISDDDYNKYFEKYCRDQARKEGAVTPTPEQVLPRFSFLTESPPQSRSGSTTPTNVVPASGAC